MFDISGQIVMITGAAGQLGRALAVGIAERGATAVITDIDREGGSALRDRIINDGGRAEFFYLDVTSPDFIRRAVKKCVTSFGRIDALVNNAGITVTTPFFKRTSREIGRVVDVNLKGVLSCSQIAAREMSKKRRGVIVNIASVYASLSPDPSIYGKSGRNSAEIYGMTKAGVVQLTRYLAVHLAKYNIRVNSISPGGIFNNQEKDFVKRYSAKTVLGRMAHEDELVGPLVFLLSDASSYICGQNLIVDGGLSIY